MFKKFNTKELVFLAFMAAFLIALNLVIGTAAATFSLEAGEFIGGITNAIVLTFVALTLNRFGAISIFYLIYSLLALPFPLGGGPPGFMLKIPLLVIPIIFFDLILYLTKFKKLGFVVGWPISIFALAIVHLLIFYLLEMPEFDKLLKALPILIIGLIVLGYLGIWIGFKIYNKLKDKRIIQQISQ